MLPWYKSIKFWQSFSLVVASLVAYYTSYKLEAGVLEVFILAVLNLFGVVPELKSRGLL